MKIDHIQIENFRSFSTCSIHFANKTTLLIGKNGSGKSNLIAALKKGLSFMFAKDENFKRLLNDSNGCNLRNFSLCWDTRFEDSIKGFCFPIKIDYKATFNNQSIQWTLLKKAEGSRFPKKLYEEALNKVLTHYNLASTSLMPTLVFFSDAFPHDYTKIASQFDKIIHQNILPRDLAYYDWDNSTNCSELWKNRYIKIFYEIHELKFEIEDLSKQLSEISEQSVNERKKIEERIHFLNDLPHKKQFEKEQNFIEQRLMQFAAPLRDEFELNNSDFEIQRIIVNKPDKKTSSIGFSFKNGKRMYFENLPQGYNRLLSMAFDIAYRSYILNEDQEPQGVVFIDEIELHLHPSLQQEVLERFRLTFPQVQLIVSTHSPLVISNIKNNDGIENKIIKLEYDGTTFSNSPLEGNLYGIDYTTTLSEIMESGHRLSNIDHLIDTYVILKLRNKEAEAQNIMKEIVAIVGKNNHRIIEEIDYKLKANS